MPQHSPEQSQQSQRLNSQSSLPPTSLPTMTTKRKHDRDWLRRLLAKYVHNHPNVPQDLKGKALVVAPMVDASDLPYRLQARRYNTSLCFTPMIHARMFIERESYRNKFWNPNGMPPQDRPLIAQFCGYDKHFLLEAMKVVESHVDGVDINCGCPQGIAKRGRYGAYLLEEDGGDNIVEIVRYLAERLNVPVSVKVRILPSGLDDSLRLYERLVDAGAAMITIHGRTRFQKKDLTGDSDWGAIRDAVRLVGKKVPVIANGSISNLDDVRKCLEVTGADGVMSSEGILEYPPLFTETNVLSTDYKRTGPGRVQLADEYLELCKEFPPEKGGQGSGMKCIRAHLHRFLHADMQKNTDVRDAVVNSYCMEAAYEAVRMVKEMHEREGHLAEDEELSWYMRYRKEWEGADGRDEDGYGEEKKYGANRADDDECEYCCEAAESRYNLFGDGADDGDY